MEIEEIKLCSHAADINRNSKLRNGNIIHFPSGSTIFVTGDLHGNVRNFERIKNIAHLAEDPSNHIIFQEILHGGPEDDQGGCLSFQLFFEILQYQLQYPEQVHLILGNHDTAIVTNSEVLKEGKEMNQSLNGAMKRRYKKHFDKVRNAVCDYLISQPLAAKTENRIWISHSLPANRYVNSFDTSIFQTEMNIDLCKRPEPVYILTWGRNQSPQCLGELAEKLDTDFFILGHQWQSEGYCIKGSNTIILGSDHSKGCIIKIDTQTKYSLDKLEHCIIPLASIE